MSSRPYNPGEDMRKYNDGVIVCQAPSGRPRGSLPICGRAVQRTGSARISGGVHELYECSIGHRFGVKSTTADGRLHRSVVDIPNEKPVFGRL